MSPRAKHEYLEAVVQRYRNADRAGKSRILDEFCTTCGHHRKHAIRLLRGFKRFTAPPPKTRGRKPLYHSPALLKPLKAIWLQANLPCSKRLKALLPLWLPGYQALFGELAPELHHALLRISPATIDRVLQPTRLRTTRRGRCTTKPGSLLRTQIPIGTNQWQQARPGFLEADTVAHCGPSAAGSSSTPSTASTSLLAGPSNARSGGGGRLPSWSSCDPSRPACPSPCWASIATTAPSSSTTTWCATSSSAPGP